MIEVTILGCGNMGRAFAEGLLAEKIVSTQSLTLVERKEDRCAARREEFGCRCSTVLTETEPAPYLILAIKPQDLAVAAESVRAVISESTVVISILAGVSLHALQSSLSQHKKLVRAMPNLPAVIGMGMTAYYPSKELSEVECGAVDAIFSAVGETLLLREEKLLNAVTAVSGSGPAYLYYFIQAWRQAAQDLGFSEQQASRLIAQTVKGSTELWEQSDYNAESLRQRVTSKGGTTEAAHRVLEEAQAAGALRRAINRAAVRAEELECLVKEAL